MKKGLTEIVFVLDQSGSMFPLREDTIGGFNSVIEKQKDQAGEALVSTILFDDRTYFIHERDDIREVRELTNKQYRPGGTTALLDALGDGIRYLTGIHRTLKDEYLPERVLFVIMTDGQENASCRFSAQTIKRMIEKQQKEYGWEFLFLGANIDAIQTARRYGINRNRAVRFRSDKRGTRLNYDVVSETISSVRQRGTIDAKWKKRIEDDYTSRGSRNS